MQLQITYVADDQPYITIMLDADLNPMIGRDPAGNDIVVHHATVSRIHARITNHDGRLVIQDLGSRSGTLVNGKPIQGLTPLRPYDLVTIGDASFKAELVDLSFELEDDGATIGMNTGPCNNAFCNARLPRSMQICMACGSRQ